jgi:hypothetical protein
VASALSRALGPSLPPALVSAFASPIVVAEALVRAVTSSGQAVLLPAGLLMLGGILRRLTRRDAPGDASSAQDESGSTMGKTAASSA